MLRIEKKYNIALVDDHKLIIDLLEMYFEYSPYSVVICSNSGKEFMDLDIAAYNIDIIILDINMPEMNGFDLLKYLVKAYPNIKIIILSSISEAKNIHTCLQYGAAGYIVKDSVASELLEALDYLVNDIKYICPIAKKSLNDLYAIDETKNLLSNREIEIIKHIIDDLSASEIAEKLNLSPRTVDNHRNKIYSKLEINNKAALVKYFYTSGLSKLFE